MAQSWLNLPCALKAAIGFDKRTLGHPTSLPRYRGRRRPLAWDRAPIILAAARNNVPAVYSLSDWVRDGGLLSYGVDTADDPYRRAASYVDRILRGEKPGDLPVQMPTKFEMVVNLKTAKALGLAIPPSIMLRATEVIDE